MRLAPVPIRYAADPGGAIAKAGLNSKTTHAHPEAIDGCRYLAALIVGALERRPNDQILSERFTPVSGLWDGSPVAAPIDRVAAGSFHRRKPPEIRGTGYVTASLEAALWAFARSRKLRGGCIARPSIWETTRIPPARYMASWRARSTACTRSRRGGANGSRRAPRSSPWPVGCMDTAFHRSGPSCRSGGRNGESPLHRSRTE